MHGHWCPQYLYISDADGNRIVSEANTLHFENLQEEFEALAKRYSCPFSLIGAKKMLASVNSVSPAEATSGGAVKKKFSVEDLSKECIDLIRSVYSEDFRVFGYDDDPRNCKNPPRRSDLIIEGIESSTASSITNKEMRSILPNPLKRARDEDPLVQSITVHTELNSS